MFRSLREPVNTLTHAVGAALALVGGIWLIAVTIDNVATMFVSLVYSLTMFVGFMASTIMHSYIGDKKVIKWLIRFDHAAIFLMIAGTYTPITYAYLDGWWRWSILGVVWVLAIAGIAWKLLTWEKDSVWQTLSYFVFVVVAFVMLPDLLPNTPPIGLTLLVLGSAMYIIGAVVFQLKRPNLTPDWGYHEIWHLFVLAGASLHFAFIAHSILT